MRGIVCDSSIGMTNESLLNEDWTLVVARLGGAGRLNATARETKAFVRPRQITNAVDLLRLILAWRERAAGDSRLGGFCRSRRYLQCGCVVPLATVRGLAR